MLCVPLDIIMLSVNRLTQFLIFVMPNCRTHKEDLLECVYPAQWLTQGAWWRPWAQRLHHEGCRSILLQIIRCSQYREHQWRPFGHVCQGHDNRETATHQRCSELSYPARSLVWRQAHLQYPVLPPPEHMGWKMEDNVLVPKLMSLPAVPDACEELVTCGCTTGCKTARCGCKPNPCTASCQCRKSSDRCMNM